MKGRFSTSGCFHPNMAPTDVLEGMLPVIGCHHPNMTLTTSRGLRPRNYISRYKVYHPSQALIATEKLRSSIYGVPPPTRCLKKILATREMLLIFERQHTGSPNAWVYLVALLKTSVTQRCSLVLIVYKTCRGNCDVPRTKATC